MRTVRIVTTGLLGLSLAASAASAQARLYSLSPSGALYSGDPLAGGFQLEVDTGQPANSLAQIGNRLYIGTTSGQILAYNQDNGTLQLAATVPNDATDMAVHEADLLISGSDGSVVRVNPRKGLLEQTFQSDFDVQALAIDGDVLYAGTPFGVFQKLDLTSPADFAFAGVCGGPINSMAFTESELYLGDSTGQVYVYDKFTEFVAYAYPVDNDASAIVREGDHFLIGGDNGSIRRVEQIFGFLVDTLTAPEAVADLWMEEPLGALAIDSTTLSLSGGGSAGFELFAPPVAGDSFVLLGSASGTSPGISSGSVHLALNPDAYFNLTLPPLGDEPLLGSVGTFDPAGGALATFVLPPGVDSSLAGLTLHHAFVAYDSADPTTLLAASNPVDLLLVP
ncbi:MAG: hypothetical protein AAF682_07170 [Planctomycetota bacterium]